MILKEKEAVKTKDKRLRAGFQQEKQVAYYLRRTFGEDPNVLVLNDIKIEHKGERAQIDHLLICPPGFVLIESKSILGETRVNHKGEWARRHREQWVGMPSPIKQLDMQAQMLKLMLSTHADQMLPRVFFVQMRFGGRKYIKFCAVSSTAIVDRSSLPTAIDRQVVKTEFIGDEIQKALAREEGLFNFDPRFRTEDMYAIARFLVAMDRRIRGQTSQPAVDVSVATETTGLDIPGEPAAPQQTYSKSERRIKPFRVQCRHCGEKADLFGRGGPYGYYVRCGRCGKNTSMRDNCRDCGRHIESPKKRGNQFIMECQRCGISWIRHANAPRTGGRRVRRRRANRRPLHRT